MGKWYHWIVLALISPIVVLFALSPFKPASLLGAFGILVIGGIGIGVMGLYLGCKTKMSNFLTYYALIAIWFWCSGFGYFRGLVMRKKEFIMDASRTKGD
jgi:predicted membrane protein